MKKCPYCAEEIQDEAIKCKHCGEFLNDERLQRKNPAETEKEQKNKLTEPIKEILNEQTDNKKHVPRETYKSKTRQEIENSGLIAKLGTIKKMKLYEEGFTVKSLTKDYYHSWNQIEKIIFTWMETTMNIFAHDHDLILVIAFKSALNIEPKDESFSPKSLYVNFSKRSIKKFIASLSVLSEIHSFELEKMDAW